MGESVSSGKISLAAVISLGLPLYLELRDGSKAVYRVNLTKCGKRMVTKNKCVFDVPKLVADCDFNITSVWLVAAQTVLGRRVFSEIEAVNMNPSGSRLMTTGSAFKLEGFNITIT